MSETGSVKNVKATIRQLLDERDSVSNSEVVKALGRSLTRQAVHLHLAQMDRSGELERVGAGRAVRYRRRFIFVKTYAIAGLAEHAVWDELQRSVKVIAALEGDALSVVSYVVTEMVNNAIEHSDSDVVELRVRSDSPYLVVDIIDQGVGVFANIVRGTDLERPIDAAQQLTLGKLTTLPERHTGEGIFFSSRAVQLFRIEANDLRLTMDNERFDWALGEALGRGGSVIHIEVDPDRATGMPEVFSRYTDDDFKFASTSTVVKLFESGVRFVSRSEAKRLASGLSKFRRVTLDFDGVTEVGQGFVDELFRVWAADHPDTILEPINCSEPVLFMIERGQPRT